MIDSAKYKTMYDLIILAIILSLIVLFAIRTGPSHEVYVDISVNPPEKARKTDFSWITVNKWFNSRVYIIMSRFILEEAKTGISKDRLRKIVSARRLGAADIIGISARSDDNITKLEEAVNGVAYLYLGQLDKTEYEIKKKASIRQKSRSK